MEPETPATESGGDGPARQPAKEVDRTKLSAVVFKHLKLEQDEGESLLEFAARYAARGAARALHERSRARLSRVRRVSCSIAPNPLPPPEGAVIKFVEDGKLGPDTLPNWRAYVLASRVRTASDGLRVLEASCADDSAAPPTPRRSSNQDPERVDVYSQPCAASSRPS